MHYYYYYYYYYCYFSLYRSGIYSLVRKGRGETELESITNGKGGGGGGGMVISNVPPEDDGM